MKIAGVLFSVTGRLSRLRFLGITMGLPLLAMPVALPLTLIPGTWTLIPFFLLIGVVNALWVMAAIRRLHDRNRTGWWLWLYLVASMGCYGVQAAVQAVTANRHTAVLAGTLTVFFVWLWVTIDLYLLPGDSGENRFGPDPLRSGLAS